MKLYSSLATVAITLLLCPGILALPVPDGPGGASSWESVQNSGADGGGESSNSGTTDSPGTGQIQVGTATDPNAAAAAQQAADAAKKQQEADAEVQRQKDLAAVGAVEDGSGLKCEGGCTGLTDQQKADHEAKSKTGKAGKAFAQGAAMGAAPGK